MKSLKGHFLVASRSLSDPNFVRTVLLIIEHSEAGAAGVILNRPTGATIAKISEEVFDEVEDWEKPIFLGGPVPGPLMALHSVAALGDQEVIEGLFTTVDPEKIRDLIRQRAEPSLFLANYAGWGAGQLEMELAQESWVFTPADITLVLEGGDASMWEAIMRRVSASILANALGIEELPEDPTVN
ncbi:YqgE/AlgH family protein [Tautonia sociabilis]|uniref:YqgE/AlgH family protein n=1 Tax=Tautonia sociabilis TaxID=2080755 RepID=A0A432MQM9_9BACT|nr:YqgE/AlgH family protein [Tautonia sociabilis]RUL89356.1 YqgE/AlgH family protein [Tautonia sociabilis]